MITLVLTNRNRDFHIVKKCLDSLLHQTNDAFELFFIDYGSDYEYVIVLQELILQYSKVKLVLCPVHGQLWNKSRAINIALKQTDTPYFLVGDVDLIFAPHFISTAYQLMNQKEIYYFQYGFLSPTESLENKEYDSYQIDFNGSAAVTGTTLFPTLPLKSINGYDEFYHGWGAEDTDIHIRMQQLGYAIKFYDTSILVKHQWHAKQYRNKTSKHPFHSGLEQINHAYMILSKETNRTIVNQNQIWGCCSDSLLYKQLKSSSFSINIILNNSIKSVSAVLAQFHNFKNESVNLRIEEVDLKIKLKNVIINRIKNKPSEYVHLEQINTLILEQIIKFHRNNPYEYVFDRKLKFIQLKMIF